MPLPIAHGLLGAGIVAAVHPEPANRSYLPLLVGAFLANAADFDFLLVFITRSWTWHRGVSHSIMLGLVVCLMFVLSLGKRHLKEAMAYGLAFTSHGILDYLTTKEGSGVGLLWPVYSEKLSLGWIGLTEFPSRLPALGIVKALVVEFIVFAPLLLLATSIRKYVWKDTGAAGRAV